MIFCQCNAISDQRIRELIAAGAASVKDITRACGAGRYCPPCRAALASMLSAGTAGDGIATN